MIRKKTSDAADEPMKKTPAKKTTTKSPASETKTVKTPAKAAKKEEPKAKETPKKTAPTAAKPAPRPAARPEAKAPVEEKKAAKATVKAASPAKTAETAPKKAETPKPAASKTVASKTAKIVKKAVPAPRPAARPAAKAPAEEKKAADRKAEKAEKIEVESPLQPQSPTTVKSSHTENIYGRHYIIDTAQDLPPAYGKDRLVVLARDPEWIFAFWEISESRAEDMKRMLKAAKLPDNKFIRIYDVTGGGEAQGGYHDIEVSRLASSWYINVKPDSIYNLELGYKNERGEFFAAVKSNPVSTPRHGMSPNVDENWMVRDSEFEKMYELSGGHSVGMSSADIMQAMARGMKPGEFSEINTLSSHVLGVSSETFSSEIMQAKKKAEEEEKLARKFWMVVNTELIVYGATEPDASVTIMGKPIKLRADGTFSIRLALPDGEIDVPVKGVSADKIDEITITPAVQKQTRYHKK